MDAVIIGSGVAGLTAGAYLARAGHHVRVFEQFPEIGGVTATIQQDGFGWDLGPLMLEGFGPGEPAGEVLAELGIAGQVRIQRDDRGIVFPDFALWKPVEYAGPHWRREKLKQLFPEDAGGLDQYYAFYEHMMDLVALYRKVERATGLPGLALKLKLWQAFNRVKAMKDWSARQVMDHFFTRPELKALYTGILADFVVRPSQFPGLGIPTVNVETAFDKRIPLQVSAAGPRPGFYYILGGCGKLVEALAGVIRSAGGEILTRAPVYRIQVEWGRAVGVVLEGGQHVPADLVVATGGARETFFSLVGKEHLPPGFATRVEDVPLMESVLMVQVGIDFDPTPYQPGALCYYYGTYDVEGAVGRCQAGEYHEGRDGFLIYIPSLHSPELAPPGCHAVTVYTIAPNRLNQGNWAERREELAGKLLIEAEKIIPGLRERAQVRVVLTPDDYQARTHLSRHSFGGCAPVMGKEGLSHRTPIQGLWFAGAQSESKGGVANAMSGARKTTRTILNH
jgi:phytoene dehydrogenase-like protein